MNPPLVAHTLLTVALILHTNFPTTVSLFTILKDTQLLVTLYTIPYNIKDLNNVKASFHSQPDLYFLLVPYTRKLLLCECIRLVRKALSLTKQPLKRTQIRTFERLLRLVNVE